MSTGKALSNGTLSLRFMQNAQRAKQQASIDLERAKVKDDAEWEVSKEIREAWGLASGSKAREQQTIVQETSYLPFLFPSLRNGGPTSNDEAPEEVATSRKISGHRTFAKGREITSNSSSADSPADVDENIDIKQESNFNAAEPSDPSKSLTERSKPRRTGGVGPLTGKRTTARLAELERADVLPKHETFASGIPVLSMISESSVAVGVDIRQMRKQKGKDKDKDKVSAATEDKVKSPASSLPETARAVTNGIGKGPLSFLRPTGVDSPAPSSTSGKKSKKREREREGDGEAGKARLESPRRKADSEAPPGADDFDTQLQVTKKKKKQMKVEPGLSTPTL